MATHELKEWPEPFLELAARRRTFEVRINDRNYQVGDELVIKRFDPFTKKLGPAFIQCRVISVVGVNTYSGMFHGLLGPNTVVLGLEFTGGEKRAKGPAKKGKREGWLL